jgi:hypothetical protein
MMDIFAEIEVEAPRDRHLSTKSSKAIIGGLNDPIRQKFYDMRGLASDNPFHWNDARLFYRQAKFMEDFTDDFSSTVELSMLNPCFQRLGYERLRTYFTWRTAVRLGEFPPICLSYIFLYAYELIACIGTQSPSEALAGLILLRENYSKAFPTLDSYIPEWEKDFRIYYDLPLPEETTDLLEWNKNSAYDITKSKFFTPENAALLEDCFAAALAALSHLCEKKSIRLKDLFDHTSADFINWTPFRRATFHPWLNQPDRTTRLQNGEIYICTNNHWTTQNATPYAHKKDLIAFIIKKTESLARVHANFKTKITADTSSIVKSHSTLSRHAITPADISHTIEAAISAHFRELTRVVVNVSHRNLQKIRVESDDITEKLVVEEKEQTVGTLSPPPPQGENFPLTPNIETAQSAVSGQSFEGVRGNFFKSSPEKSFLSSLTDTEKSAIKAALSGEFEAYAMSCGLMAEIIADGINEKAMDTIGDNILDEGFGVYEDYLQYLS